MNKPKGTIVFASGKAGDYDIWSLDLTTGQLKQLTQGDFLNDCPMWSPDGSRILFISTRTGTREIWMMKEDGTGQTQITDTKRWHDSPAWSPDGGSIAFCANYDGNTDIYTMKLDGTGRQQITDYPGMDFTPRYSPDGKKLIFTSQRSGNDDIWSYEFATRGFTQLTDYPDKDYTPAYSPDGKQIAWVRANFVPDLVTGTAEDMNVWLMNADGSNQRRLTVNPGIDRHCAWSPDGAYLIYTSAPSDSTAERLKIIGTASEKNAKVDYDRSPLEENIWARPVGIGMFYLLPKTVIRKLYPDDFFGTERHPDWK